MISAVPAEAAWTGVIAAIGTFFGWLTTRNRDRADVTSVLSETSLEWIHELRSEIGRLRSEIVTLEAEIATLEARGNRLTSWLREQGLDFPGEHEREG